MRCPSRGIGWKGTTGAGFQQMCLAVNLASMAHADHVYHEFFVKQVAHNTKFTDTVTPCMRITLHGFALVTRVTFNKFFEEVENPALYLPV